MTSAQSVYTRDQVEELLQEYQTALHARDHQYQTAIYARDQEMSDKDKKISDMVVVLKNAATSLADFTKLKKETACFKELKKTNADLTGELEANLKQFAVVIETRNSYRHSNEQMAGYVKSELQTRTSALELALKTIQTLADDGTNVSRDRAPAIGQSDVNASEVSVQEASRESGGGGAAGVPSADDQARQRREKIDAMLASK
jgi:hypothetical protein